MRLATRAFALAVALAVAVPALPAAAQEIMPPTIPPEILVAITPPEPPRAEPRDTPPPVVIPATIVDYEAAMRYFWKTVENYVRALPADQLIRLWWKDTPHVETMLRIARRESGFNCAADNPRSSASGLFQTLSLHRPRAERLGLSWHDITGADCLSDVKLAWAIYKDSGLAPWRLTA